jgi:two-component system chemotaxis sensor kinase CheA
MLQGIFALEAQEHLDALGSGLLALETAPAGEAQAALVETIYREAHSLKGAAGAVNMVEIESRCQKLESMLATLKRGEQPLTPALLDILHQAVREIESVLQGTTGPAPPRAIRPSGPDERPSTATAPLLNEHHPYSQAAPNGAPVATEAGAALTVASRPSEASRPSAPPLPPVRPSAVPPPPGRNGADTIRVSTAKLDSLLLQAEELLSAKLTPATGRSNCAN